MEKKKISQSSAVKKKTQARVNQIKGQRSLLDSWGAFRNLSQRGSVENKDETKVWLLSDAALNDTEGQCEKGIQSIMAFNIYEVRQSSLGPQSNTQ